MPAPSILKNDLCPRRIAFVAEYLRQVGQMGKTCEKLGISRPTGERYLKEPEIQKMIREARDKIMAEAVYDTAKAMREAEEAIEFAKDTQNANAYVKAVELRSKLSGLLVEKIDVRQATGFQIRIGIPGLSAPAVAEALPVPVESLPPATIDVPKLVAETPSDPFEDDNDPFS